MSTLKQELMQSTNFFIQPSSLATVLSDCLILPLILEILNHYLQNFKEDSEEVKKLFKNLADANTRVIILSLIEHLNMLETDQKFLELFRLLGYILSHLQQKHFDTVKDKIHEFFQRSIESAIAQNKKINQTKEVLTIYQNRDQILQKMVGSILVFKDADTVKLVLDLFQPGKVPDYLSLSFLQLLIKEQGENIQEQANELLSKFLSTCTLVQSTKMRTLYCEIMLQLYDNLAMSLENQGEVNVKAVENLTISIYSMIQQEWLAPTVDPDCVTWAVSLIGYMIKFFPDNQLEKVAEKIVEEFIAQMKKNTSNITIWNGFNKVLEKLLSANKPYFEHSVKSIQVKLYELYKGPIFSVNYPFDPEVQKKKNYLLQILQNLAEFNTDCIIDLYISRHNSKEIIEKVSALWISNFLCNRNYSKMSIPMKKQLVNSLQNLQFETNVEVRFAIVELIFSLCCQAEFFQEVQTLGIDTSFMLFFLMKQVSIHPQEILEKNNAKFPPFLTTLESLKGRSNYVLQVLTTQSVSDQKNTFIWPFILHYIPNPSFSPGLSSALKSASTYLTKYKELNSSLPNQSLLVSSDKIPKINTILARLIILLRIPQYFKGLGEEILNSIPYILPAYLNKELPSEINSIIRDLKYTISREEEESKLSEKIYSLWKILLEQFENRDWFGGMNDDMIAMHSSYCKIPELQVHMMKLHGLVLTKLDSQETIKTQLDRFITQVYNDYSHHTVNPNIDRIEPVYNMRLCLADSFALVASQKLDLVIDKIRNVFNSTAIPKKQASGFAQGLLGMLKKATNEEDLITPISSNLVLTLGYICNRLQSKELSTKMEGQIVNNLIPFMDKNGEDMQMSVQRCLEMVSRSVVRVQSDCEENQIKELKRVFIKYKQLFFDKSMNVFKNSKLPNIKTVAWETIAHLLKLEPAYNFEVHFIFFQECIRLLENEQNMSSFESPAILLFECMLHHQKLVSSEVVSSNIETTPSKENQEGIFISLWEILSRMVKYLKTCDMSNSALCFYYNCLLKALYNKKLKAQDSNDTQHLTKILVILLSDVYKAPGELQKVCLLILEKTMLGLSIFLQVGNTLDIEIYNQDLILQLSSKLSFEELQRLVNESVERVIADGSVSVLNGFTSLQNKFYRQNEERLSDELNSVLKSYQQVFEVQEQLGNDEEQKNLLIGYVVNALEKNLQKGLDIFLDDKVYYILPEFQQRVLTKIVENKGTLFKAFNHLTDILNNPEDKLFKSKGQAMTNAIHFIGFIFSLNQQVLLDVTKKYFPSIFGTFLLRFATSFDYELNKNASFEQFEVELIDGINAPKICLLSFKKMLENSSKSCFLDGLSVGLQQKLIEEDQFEDGMSELLMVISKNSKLSELKDIMEFLKPFLQKKLISQKQLCLTVASQLIQCSFFSSDFKDYRKTPTVLEEWYNFLIDTLLAQVHENSENIRSVVYRGIGNITYLNKYNIAGQQSQQQVGDSHDIPSGVDQKTDEIEKKISDEINSTKNQQLLDENLAENLSELMLKEEEQQVESNQTPLFFISNQRYSEILEVLFDGLDDSSDTCVKDSLNSMQNMIAYIQDSSLEPYLHTLLMKVTLNFEKQNLTDFFFFVVVGNIYCFCNRASNQIRTSSFNLFGKLIEKISLCKEAEEYLETQLHFVIISIIVHLQDESRQVRDVCKLNLGKISAVLPFPLLGQQIEQQENDSDEQDLEDNDLDLTFLDKDERNMLQLMKVFLTSFPAKIPSYIETLSEYTKSPEDKIKCSSILNLFLAFKYLGNELDHLELSQSVRERLSEIMEKSNPSSKINKVDKYILKGSVLLIKSIDS